MHSLVQDILIICGVIAAVFWWFQLIFAFIASKQQKYLTIPDDIKPSISVVIPVFNETQERIDRTVWSVLSQRNVNLDIIVVDDGSSSTISVPKHPSITLLKLNDNCGKRVAQIKGIEQAKYDWIATVDSDTVLDDNAILWLYITCQKQKTNACTGSVFLSNENENLLTKITSCVYWFSFFQERASQSFFGSVVCCSGALSIYKKSIILENKNDYLQQKFFGKICSAGDDRQLTSIFLLSGNKVGWSANSVAWTHSPEKLIPFLTQQLRWIRSHVSSVNYLVQQFSRWKFWPTIFSVKLIFRYAYLLVLYFGLFISSFYLVSIYPFVVCLISIMVVAVIKTGIVCLQTRKTKFLYLLLYTLFAFFIFNPLLMYGLVTPTKTGWLTRKKNRPGIMKNGNESR